MANRFYIVVTKQNRFIICEPRWIKKPIIGCYTKVFQSPDAAKVANFTLAPRYYIKSSVDSCYEVFVIKKYQSREQAEKYTSRMRPMYPIRKSKENMTVLGNVQKFRFSKIVTVDHIDLDCDTPESSGLTQSGQVEADVGSNLSVTSLSDDENNTDEETLSNTTIETDSAEADISIRQRSDVNHTLESSGSTQGNQTEADFESNLSESSISDVENDAGEQTHSSTTVETDSAEADVSIRQRDEPVPYDISNTGTHQEVSLGSLIDDKQRLRDLVNKLNEHLGDIIVTDSSDESVDDYEERSENMVNTRNYQIDNQLAPNYYFITNQYGDRYFLSETTKLSLRLVRQIKTMNSVYPKTHADFDKDFLTDLLKEVFSLNELLDCKEHSSLKCLNRSKLKLVKVIFLNRVGIEKDRIASFRNLVMEVAQDSRPA